MAKIKRQRTKKPKAKIKKVRFYGLNITLQSKSRKGANVYKSLIREIHNSQMHFVVGAEIMMVLRTMHETKFAIKQKEFSILYGKLLRFNTIKNWYNQKAQLFEEFQPPQDLVPNAFETDYVFIPELHKFFIRYNHRINIYQTKTFILKALAEIIHSDEKLHVNILTSNDKIDAILTADSIKNLDILVSYTNDDINEEAEELIDRMLKDAQSGEASITLKPDANGTLNSDSNLVKGLIGVAKDNGTIKARVVNNGRSSTIQTYDYPEKINLEIEETDGVKDDEKEILFYKMMAIYRQIK